MATSAAEKDPWAFGYSRGGDATPGPFSCIVFLWWRLRGFYTRHRGSHCEEVGKSGPIRLALLLRVGFGAVRFFFSGNTWDGCGITHTWSLTFISILVRS